MNALQINYWLKQHWKLLVICVVAVVVLAEVIFQIVYPSSRLIPGTTVDGLNLGGKKYTEAAKVLDEAYGDLKLAIYFGNSNAAFQSPKMSDVGIGVDNAARLEKIEYPLYLRIIPTSLFWAPSLSQAGEIAYTYDKAKIASYTTGKVGDDCSIEPQNASVKLIDSKLQLVPAVSGGQCDINEFQRKLAEVKPTPYEANQVRISIDPTSAPITDDIALDLVVKLNARLGAPMPMQVDASTDTIPGRVVLSWLDFTPDIPGEQDKDANKSATLKFSVNQKRMETYLNQNIAAKLVQKPGVSKVSTYDFNETSRVNGANGRGIDLLKTARSVEDYINNKNQKAVGETVVIGPTVVYTRSYSPTSNGFNALFAQFAQDNPGTYGISFQELTGVSFPRSGSYRGDERMPAAGIHSLYLAYTNVMEEDAGTSRPVDIIDDGRNATDCFKDMLQNFDEGCRTGFYDHFGYAKLTSRAKQLGLKNTVFAGEQTLTSANDLRLLLAGLSKGDIARLEGGSKILSTIRSVRDNDGIPKGISSGQTTHAIGESDVVFNDAGIINSTNKGSYVLTVLTKDGSSWEKIAELTKKIEAIKAMKIPKDAR
jgi:beta-lactamase class A